MANTKIAKNNTGSAIDITDTGVTIPASGQYTINPSEFLIWAQSDDIVTEVGNGNVTINDGSDDLNISDGIDLIKGIFQKSRIIGDSDGVLIGNEGDKLKVTGGGKGEELEIKPALSYQADLNKMTCLLDEVVRQLRILNTHMECVTDLEDLEEEPGDHPLV